MTIKIIATNRKAQRDYTILEKFECGVELKGSEVKSLRHSKANLNDSFAKLDQKGIILYNCYISPYEQSSIFSSNIEPTRPRRLLLHKAEIRRIASKVSQRGFALIPLKIYFNQRGFAKVELALARGKKLFDKRTILKERQIQMEVKRALRRK